MGYPFREIEEKWRKRWDEMGLYRTKERPSRKLYLLEMYPYPSGDLHIGQFKNYVIGDVIGRMKLMEGYDILHPFGWDAFGLPAEEAAIQRGIDPEEWTLKNIKISRETLKLMGIGYDWDREVTTCLPDYYRWTQWLFLKLYEQDLAYRKRAYQNWCPHCQTVLANEQVELGSCWRCSTPVTKKELTQWFFKITDYAERLLNDLERLDGWPEQVKTLQRNWIGRSEGVELDFPVEGSDSKIPIFTTRPDTIYGVTFMAIAPENELLGELIKGNPQQEKVLKYVEESLKRTEIERVSTEREKDGVFIGRYAVNPFSGEKVEIWVADYVLPSYGTGVVMAVPAHDQRDFEFSKKYGIPVKIAIEPPGEHLKAEEMEEAYVEPGVMVESGAFTGMPSEEGIEEVTNYATEKGLGRRKVNYRLRDWLISRQRYWGAPIPMVHCDTCGVVPVPYDQLPVLLPKEGVDFTPKGRSPLASVPYFIQTTCPRCKGKAWRDPDTMDTFVDSSWYHLRYADPHNKELPFAKEPAQEWLPIDQYIGGIEHACGHLIYFRFLTKFLYDVGISPVDEPCLVLFNHGMVTDKHGAVMSKSKGNAVPAGPFVKEWGADTGRITILFAGPPGKDSAWSEEGVTGANRFLNRVYRLITESLQWLRRGTFNPEDLSDRQTGLYRKLQWTIKKVTEDLDDFGHNTAIAALMELLNDLYRSQETRHPLFAYSLEILVKLLAPFAPHLSEELWEMLGNEETVFRSGWPVLDPEGLKEEMTTIVVQVNGRLRSRLLLPAEASEEEVKEAALADEKARKHIEGKTVKKVIHVPKRLVNIVVT